MICPSCLRNVTFKERPQLRCKRCGNRFALEPRRSLLRTGDIRLRKASEALSCGGALRYTESQLFWRLARNRLRSKPTARARRIVLLGGPVGVVIGVAAGASFRGHPVVAGVVGAGLGLLLAVLVAVRWEKPRRLLPASAEVRGVRTLALEWRALYGKGIPGLASEKEVEEALRATPVADPVAVVASDDQAALGCLALNGVPALLGLVLLHLGDPSDIGDAHLPDAPVLLLHDASAAGFALLAAARDRWGAARVMDLGLHVAEVRSEARLPVLRSEPIVGDLGVELDPVDRKWVGAGHSVVLAALSPLRLVRMVEGAVAGLSATQPDRRRARMTGFM